MYSVSLADWHRQDSRQDSIHNSPFFSESWELGFAQVNNLPKAFFWIRLSHLQHWYHEFIYAFRRKKIKVSRGDIHSLLNCWSSISELCSAKPDVDLIFPAQKFLHLNIIRHHWPKKIRVLTQGSSSSSPESGLDSSAAAVAESCRITKSVKIFMPSSELSVVHVASHAAITSAPCSL